MKILKIIILNIFITIIGLILIDITFSWINYCKDIEEMKDISVTLGFDKEEMIQIPPFSYSLRQPSFKNFYREESKNFDSERRISKAEYSEKGSIIIFGDSFAEGAWLEDEETFNFKLSKLTNRTVYNRGFSGTGPSVLVYQTKSQILYDSIDIIPEYAIYIYIPNHIHRTFWGKYGSANGSNIPYIGYKEKDGKLKEDYSFIHNINRLTFPRRYIENFQVEYIENNPELALDFVKLHFFEAKRELQKKYPNIKFIILKHPQEPELNETNKMIFNSDKWKEFEAEDIQVYNLGEYLNINLFEKEYILPDFHPSARLWDVVSEKLQNDLNL